MDGVLHRKLSPWFPDEFPQNSRLRFLENRL